MNSINKILSVSDLSKSYYSIKDEVKVLNNISFDVYSGDFIGIVGPSGCGKSSILNILGGLDNYYVGDVRYSGEVKIGYMFQSDALFNWLTVYENAIMGLKISKKLTKANIEYVNKLLSKYDLASYRNKYPYELSGGMKQRLALIRTLAIHPDILLLDEPYSALDYQTRIKVCNDVYNIIKEENKTIIIVTHDISEAISMCNKIIVLSGRPSYVKDIIDVKLNNNINPILNRSDEKFSYYYDLIWRKIDCV